MQVMKLTPSQWSLFAADAHKIAFGERKDPATDRIDYALLVVNDRDEPAAYVTCREHDASTVYWQFGGGMPTTVGTHAVLKTYLAMIDWARRFGYDRITTLIENTNTAMLRLAMKAGFRIVGVRTYKGSILLEHLLEFQGEG